MDTKLNIDPNVILTAYKTVGDGDIFTQIMLATAYYVKYRGRLPKKFTPDEHPASYNYFIEHIKPVLDGKPEPQCNVGPELFALIDRSNYFDDDERKLIKDMLEMWWGRGKFSRTEMIYTQKMCYERTGVESEKFVELRKWLKANGVLDWENRPYNDYLTSYHTFNEAKLLELLKNEDKPDF